VKKIELTNKEVFNSKFMSITSVWV